MNPNELNNIQTKLQNDNYALTTTKRGNDIQVQSSSYTNELMVVK